MIIYERQEIVKNVWKTSVWLTYSLKPKDNQWTVKWVEEKQLLFATKLQIF